VLVRVLTDGLDNDPVYHNRTAEDVLAELQRDFPEVDGETIRANLVLLGDLELHVRPRPGFAVSRDPNFTVIFPPVIAWAPQVVHVGSNVLFFERSQLGYRYFDWFVDGQLASRQSNFAHVFTKSGRHTVTLRVATADGLRESRTEVVEVLEPQQPVPLAPRMSFVPAAPQPGDTVRFFGWATGEGVTFSWRLDGQEFGMGPEAERTFEQEGKFDVALIVTDARGRREETRQAIIIAEQPLQVAFSAPQQVLSGQDVQFANETQPAERVSKWAWDFGDGVTSQDWNPLHRFANEGEASRVFNVVLRATSRSGRTYTSAPQSITVLPAQKPVPPPKAAFRILGGPFRAGRMVAFQDESTGLIESFAWDFNGEGTDDRKNPELRFDTAGIKTIRLVVRGPGGTATASQQITVEPREVSAYLVWLNTNGQSIALPSRLDYGIANPVHVRNQELIVTVNDTFEVIVPQEMQRG
jgi:PKD repeat protein